jgi:uncharacterized protein YggE
MTEMLRKASKAAVSGVLGNSIFTGGEYTRMMRKSGLVFVLVSFCPLAFGQLDSNSITVSASNNANLQPDQAVFSVTVVSSITSGLDDVLAALQGSGITAANLTGVSTQSQSIAILSNGPPPTPAPTLGWTFSLPVPLTNTKATVATLTTVQQNIANLNNGMTLSFNIVGTQVSQQLAQSQTCSLSALIASATTQAQNLANASSLTLGSILALSSATSSVGSATQGVVEVGAFVSTLSSAIPPPCAVTVRFNVTRN